MVGSIKKALKQSEVLRAVVQSVRVLPRRLGQWRSWVSRGRAIRRYLEANEVRRLHLGAGPNRLDGWLNTDFYPRGADAVFLDVSKPFPLPDGCIDYVYSEHMIEHLDLAEARHMLRECRRVLRPDGKIRIATPGLEAMVALYGPDRSEDQEHYLAWIAERCYPGAGLDGPCLAFNSLFLSWGHRFVFDRATLRHLLETEGFSDVRDYPVGQSDAPILRGLERHGRVIGDEAVGRLETIVVEARRPD